MTDFWQHYQKIMEILTSRQKRGTIHGNDDNR